MSGGTNAVVVEELEPVSGLAWTVLRGERSAVMRELGRVHAREIHAWREHSGGAWERLVQRSRNGAAETFESVVAATRARLPLEASELAWLAQGADLDEAELWALNLRGDLGRDGTGCSDVCALGEDSGVVMGHNEDGDADLAGLVRLVSLDIDGDPSLTVVWYPGMLPANSFVTTSAGLSFGCDHMPVATPDRAGVGRHFLARHAQRQADGDTARRVLAQVPCAGGFAFDVADGPGGRGDLVEVAAGRVATATAGADSGALRHTNHQELLDPTAAHADGYASESRSRLARVGEGLGTETPGAGEVLAALRGPGVFKSAASGSHTFSTTVVDTGGDRILVQGESGRDPWLGVLSEFARGRRVTIRS